MNLSLMKKYEKQKTESIWSYPTCLGTYDIESRTNLASEYINYISPFNKDNNSICLSNDSKNNKSSKNYLKYNISSNTFTTICL